MRGEGRVRGSRGRGCGGCFFHAWRAIVGRAPSSLGRRGGVTGRPRRTPGQTQVRARAARRACPRPGGAATARAGRCHGGGGRWRARARRRGKNKRPALAFEGHARGVEALGDARRARQGYEELILCRPGRAAPSRRRAEGGGAGRRGEPTLSRCLGPWPFIRRRPPASVLSPPTAHARQLGHPPPRTRCVSTLPHPPHNVPMS